MKAAIHISNSKHQHIHAEAMAECLRLHGITTEFFTDNPPNRFDFLVFWGWRKAKLWRVRGYECLIMERGYLGDRFNWTSLGWNGINGNAQFNKSFDTGERFEKHYGSLVRPWRDGGDYALVMGQVPGDAALNGIDIMKWAKDTYNELNELGYDVKYRHHPLATRYAPPVPHFDVSLDEAINNARLVVTYNSNTGVDSVIRGATTITLDKGAMAWPVTTHNIHGRTLRLDRKQWLIDLSWRQWSLDEISSGLVWEYIKPSNLKHTNYNALIIGGGPDVWKEAEQAFNEYRIDYVIAINNAIQDYPGRIDMAITLHPVKMAAWLNNRKDRGYSDIKEIVAHKEYDGFNKSLEYKWPEMKYSGSSGLFAVKAAMEIADADKIILAGVPMNTLPHYYKTVDKPWNDCNAFLPAWKSALPRIKDKVRSFSGFTRELLGSPTKEWING